MLGLVALGRVALGRFRIVTTVSRVVHSSRTVLAGATRPAQLSTARRQQISYQRPRNVQ